MIREHDRVVLTTDLTGEKLAAGSPAMAERCFEGW